MTPSFYVGITRNCFEAAGGSGLFTREDFSALDGVPGLSWEIITESGPEISVAQSRRYDVIFALQPRLSPAIAGQPDCRLRLLALSGSGFDTVDLDLCDRMGILVVNTPGAVARSVATAILTLILALSHRLMIKDRLTRTGRWGERTRFMGTGLSGKVVGSVGFGNIARETFRLLRPLGMEHIVTSPRADPAQAAAEGVRLVDLDELMRQSDFVCVNCPLKPDTTHLIDASALGLMKPTAYLINTSRGPIVDEGALYKALVDGQIAGAALDVFEEEPVPADNPLLRLDNVIVTPHALAWTRECFQRIAADATASILDVIMGRSPRNIIRVRA